MIYLSGWMSNNLGEIIHFQRDIMHCFAFKPGSFILPIQLFNLKCCFFVTDLYIMAIIYKSVTKKQHFINYVFSWLQLLH